MTEYLLSVVRGYTENYAGLPKACWLGIIFTFIQAIAIGICFFLSLYFVNTLHFDIALAGMMMSFYGAGTVLGGLVSGKLSDRISTKNISSFSLLIQSMTFFLLIKLKSAELLMINLFILGLSSYGFKTSNNVWMLRQCQERSEVRLKAISISHVASNLGLGVSGIIIGVFTNIGFQAIFYFSAIILFLSAVYLICQEKDRKSNIKNTDGKNEINIIRSDRNKQKILILVLSCVFFVGMIISQLSSTYPIYVQDSFPQLGITAITILYILDTVLIVLFQAHLINFLTGRNKMLIVGVGALFMGTGMLVLSFSFVFILAIISCVIWTTGEMLFMPMAQLICYEKGGEKRKGQSMGIFQSTFASSTVAGPAVGGLIYQSYGGNMLWYLSAMIGLGCLIICANFRNCD